MIEYKDPSESQKEEMTKFNAAMNVIMEMIMNHKDSRQGLNAFTKAEECVSWFNLAVMNKNNAQDPVREVEGELLQGDAA